MSTAADQQHLCVFSQRLYVVALGECEPLSLQNVAFQLLPDTFNINESQVRCYVPLNLM